MLQAAGSRGRDTGLARMHCLLGGSLARSSCCPPAPSHCPPGGVSRFYRGFSPCLMRAAPANAVMLFTVDKVRGRVGAGGAGCWGLLRWLVGRRDTQRSMPLRLLAVLPLVDAPRHVTMVASSPALPPAGDPPAERVSRSLRARAAGAACPAIASCRPRAACPAIASCRPPRPTHQFSGRVECSHAALSPVPPHPYVPLLPGVPGLHPLSFICRTPSTQFSHCTAPRCSACTFVCPPSAVCILSTIPSFCPLAAERPPQGMMERILLPHKLTHARRF